MRDGILSYNIDVTADELWRQVGRELRDVRESRELNYAQVQKKTGIDPKTIQSIEAGDPGTVEKLQALAEAFGLSCVDVLSTVLDRTKKPITPEANALLRRFEKMNWKHRGIVLGIAQSLYESEGHEGEP